MGLRFVLGSAGSGKSYEMYKEITEQSNLNENTRYFIIVPEQFTFQVQKDVIALQQDGGIMNIDILSFTRLAYRVFEEIGGYSGKILEETGKSMVLRKVMELKKKELGIFAGSIRKTGFVGEVKNFLTEMYQYDITEEKMNNLLELTQKNSAINNKLKDMLTIYKGFTQFLGENLITQDKVLGVLDKYIEKAEFLKDSVIALDGFTGFTEVQYKIIEKLLKTAKSVTVAFTIDSREKIYFKPEDIQKNNVKIDEYRLFGTIQKSMVKLLEIAKQNNIPKEKDIVLKETQRFKNNPAMKSLERNIFRVPYDVYKGEQDNISVYSALNPNEEIEFIARQILELVREKGYRYKDIAVVTGDMEEYSEIIDRVFLRNNIPCFTDMKRNILGNPFVELILSVLEVIEKDFSYESMFRYLRCGLVNVEKEEIDIIENYVLATGIRGKSSWEKQWVKRKSKKFARFDFEQLNILREKIVIEILPLRTVFRDKESTVKQKTIALWDFIQNMEIQKQLEIYKNSFQQKNEVALAKQYEQIFKVVVELLDKFVEIFGEEIMSASEYLSILQAGFEEIKLGLIPPGLDQIVVGDIGRTRLKDIKALFFVGVNDGIVPKVNNGGGVISDIEKQVIMEGTGNKEFLKKNNIEIPPTAAEKAYIEKLNLYINLTKPSEKLYISFSNVGLDGKSRRPSYIINNITKLFENLEIKAEDSFTGDEFISVPETTLSYISPFLREYKIFEENEIWHSILKWYSQNENWKEKLDKLIEAAFYINREKGLSKEVAKTLYGSEITNSITRLEQYAQCPYAHFLSYGLQLEDREVYKFMSYDLGNIFHSILELFSKKLKENNEEWKTIVDDDRDKLIEECVKIVTEEYGNDILKSSARNEYMIKRIERIAKRTVWALQHQLQRGKFEPSSYEIQFSAVEDLESINISLSDDEKMKLVGRIDRVDKLVENDKVYLKIIDYKSGSVNFDMLAVYYGLQLQLVVYMNAAMELEKRNLDNEGKEIVPAGIFYYHINDPMIESDPESTEEEIKQEILKKLKLDGLVNDDYKVINSLDDEFNGRSKILPITITKEGKKSANLITNKQFTEISKYVNEKIKTFGKEMFDGNISINPYKLKDESACKYCKYKAICGFDKNIEGNYYNKLKTFDDLTVWENIEKQIETEEKGE